jgi:hypothetical protein
MPKESLIMNNATRLAEQLTDQSVLGEWFKPIEQALGKVRFSDKKYAPQLYERQ